MKAMTQACLMSLLLLVSSLGQADLTIEITRGSDRAIPVAVVPFSGGEDLPEDLARIVHDDLERSGMFAPLSRDEMIDTPSRGDEVRFGDWRALDVRYLVVARVERDGDGVSVRYELMDVSGERRMLGEVVTAGEDELRSAGHYISDQVFEEITDIRGAFSTRIAYVTARGSGDDMRFALYVADADGHNSQRILASDEPILSPDWSPDGDKLAYVSFETERPAIYIQDVGSGQRLRASSSEGINGAPAWSPDGRRLAMSLSKDGQPEIYVMDVGAREFRRITDNSSIDTEPSWSPDGESLVFTSDRSGGPQIYRHDFASGESERLTFTGNYNSRARFHPDGESIFMIHRTGDGYQVARQELDNDRLVVLSESTQDESPSVAPNGTMVIFATRQGDRGVLGAVSSDGRASFRLPSAEGDVREPAWSPFLD